MHDPLASLLGAIQCLHVVTIDCLRMDPGTGKPLCVRPGWAVEERPASSSTMGALRMVSTGSRYLGT